MKQRFSTRTRLVSALLTLAMVFTFLPFSAFAATDSYGPIYLDDRIVPDDTFREYLLKQFDKDGNGVMTPAERYAVTEIDVHNKGITTLEGIQFFPNLKRLDCYNNQLTSLDVSKNKELEHLNCDGNQLTSLQLDDCTKLGTYNCDGNEYSVQVYESTRILDPGTLPGNFDISRVRNMKGATKNADGTMTVNPGEEKVLYEYRLFRDYYDHYYVIFTLNVEFIPEDSIKQVNLRVNTPKKNEMPDETVVILDNGADVCDAKIYWVEGDDVGGKPIPDTFRPGKRYTLQVGLYAKPGYKFSKDTVCTVNGRETELSWTQNDDTEYYAIKHYSVPLSPGGFEHDHKMEMTHDEHSHWMECPICHTVQDIEDHVYDDDKDTTCNVCGYVRSLTPGGSTPGGSTGGDTPGGGSTGGGDGGGAIVIVAAAGAVAAGVVGYGVYNYVSGRKLQALLPEGVAAPENRAQTALLLWNTAGRPEPAEAPAFADVADPDTAKAAQWCVEQGLMKSRLNGKFAPGSSIPAYQVLNAYRKLAGG